MIKIRTNFKKDLLEVIVNQCLNNIPMKITEKFLHEIVKFLFEQACDNANHAELEIDRRYYEGRRNSYELIKLLLEGDNYELADVLMQMETIERYDDIENNLPF